MIRRYSLSRLLTLATVLNPVRIADVAFGGLGAPAPAPVALPLGRRAVSSLPSAPSVDADSLPADASPSIVDPRPRRRTVLDCCDDILSKGHVGHRETTAVLAAIAASPAAELSEATLEIVLELAARAPFLTLELKASAVARGWLASGAAAGGAFSLGAAAVVSRVVKERHADAAIAALLGAAMPPPTALPTAEAVEDAVNFATEAARCVRLAGSPDEIAALTDRVRRAAAAVEATLQVGASRVQPDASLRLFLAVGRVGGRRMADLNERLSVQAQRALGTCSAPAAVQVATTCIALGLIESPAFAAALEEAGARVDELGSGHLIALCEAVEAAHGRDGKTHKRIRIGEETAAALRHVTSAIARRMDLLAHELNPHQARIALMTLQRAGQTSAKLTSRLLQK